MSPSLIQILLLGAVQGAAELLPVSSSAHVIAAEKLMHLDPASPQMTFLLVMLHTGTMAAVIVYFWTAWKRSFFASGAAFRSFFIKLCLATAATAVVGLPLMVAVKKLTHAPVEALFGNLPLIGACLVCSGGVILASGLKASRVPQKEAGGANGEIWMGAVQGLVLPFRGLSRSGTTISVGMLRSMPQRAAEEFSFALAVVITPPAILMELRRFYKERAASEGAVHLGSLLAPGLLGLCCSFVAGWLALRWLSSWLENGRWQYFGYYCFAAALAIFAMSGLGY